MTTIQDRLSDEQRRRLAALRQARPVAAPKPEQPPAKPNGSARPREWKAYVAAVRADPNQPNVWWIDVAVEEAFTICSVRIQRTDEGTLSANFPHYTDLDGKVWPAIKYVNRDLWTRIKNAAKAAIEKKIAIEQCSGSAVL